MIDSRRRSPGTSWIFAAIVAGLLIEIYTGAWTDPVTLARLGAIVPYYIIIEGQYWRLLSAMFLHGDGTIAGTFLHLGVNLWALSQLGSLYELMFGTRRFIAIYFASGVVASISSLINNVGASVGASGAIFGILGAFVFSVFRSPRWRHERAARSIVHQVIFWIVANIAIGMRIPQIDNAAHIGGLIAGLLLGAVLPHRTPPPPAAGAVIDVRPYDEGRGADPEGRRDDRSWRE